MLSTWVISGVFLTALFIELVGIYPGGIIVPAYLAFYIDQPLRIAVTLGISLLTWGLYQLPAGWFVIYGRRRFIMMILISALLSLLYQPLAYHLGAGRLPLQGIGLVIPGLIANNYEQQGFLKTSGGLVVTTFLLGLLYRYAAL